MNLPKVTVQSGGDETQPRSIGHHSLCSSTLTSKAFSLEKHASYVVTFTLI